MDEAISLGVSWTVDSSRQVVLDLNQLKSVPPDTLAFSADVVSMYPSIDPTEGMAVIRAYFTRFRQELRVDYPFLSPNTKIICSITAG